MGIMQQLNSSPLYLISGVIILFVVCFSLFFLIRAYRTGLRIGLDKSKLKRAITSSFTFTIIPSISILLGVIALSGTLGVPLPWLRLSVIGALHYETSVADIAARSAGLSGLNGSEMTAGVFTTIGLVMTIGIIWGCICMIFFAKPYSRKLQKMSEKRGSNKGFGDSAMTAMFIGLISAYAGSYIAQLVQFKDGGIKVTGEYLQLVAFVFSAISMAVFIWFSEKKKKAWLDSFSLAGSMIIGMAAAVVCNMIFS